MSRARAVDLLERLGESERAVLQLDAWCAHVPADFAARLQLRAAQLELKNGERAHARERLETITAGDAVPDDAWVALLDLIRADDGADPALELAARALAGGEGAQAARDAALERGRGVGVAGPERSRGAPRHGGAHLRAGPRAGRADARAPTSASSRTGARP